MADATTTSDLGISGAPLSIPSVAETCGSGQHGATACPLITLIPGGDSEPFGIPGSAHTLEGFRAWALSDACPEHGRFTFAEGELIIDMSPESIEEHNYIKTEITSVLHIRAKQLKLGRIYSDGCLFSNPQAGISTQPDASFALHETLRSARCQVVRSNRPGVREEIVGSPDWVLEILSRTSVRKDKKLLFDGYFRAGVAEYWLVDALGDELQFEVLVPGEAGYVNVKPRNGWLDSPTFGCSFNLSRARDDDGAWEYTLNVEEK